VDEVEMRRSRTATFVRVGLVALVVLWIFGPAALRSAFPIWLVFLVALGLELQFLVGALRASPAQAPDRRPQQVDLERYGFEPELDEDDLDGLDDLEADELDDLEAAVELEAEVAPEQRGLPTPVRRFLVGLGLIAALVLAIWFVDSRTGWDSLSGATRLEAVERFSAEASRIAGKEVAIGCDESRDYVGVVQHADGVATVGGEQAYLTPERCHDLYRLAFEDDVTWSRTARALAVLAHEAWHLRGVGDEGTAECYALQSGVELGRRLGLSEDTARRMMRQQLTENALRGVGTLEYVVSPDCRDGGPLDLHPSRASFP
jgi:hypothetical protein